MRKYSSLLISTILIAISSSHEFKYPNDGTLQRSLEYLKSESFEKTMRNLEMFNSFDLQNTLIKLSSKLIDPVISQPCSDQLGVLVSAFFQNTSFPLKSNRFDLNLI